MDSEFQREHVRSKLLQFMREGILTDITLETTDGIQLHAHKAILAAGSAYFNNLFRSGLRETNALKVSLAIPAEIGRLLLDIIYGTDVFSTLEDMKYVKLRVDIARALIYYQVDTFDPSLFLEAEPVGKSAYYLSLIAEVYPEGIPQKMIDLIALYGPELDLSDYSDDFISAVLLSPKYSPKNITDIYELIKQLVEKGHDPELLKLINYNLFPPELKTAFSPEFLEKYNVNGPLPVLPPLGSSTPLLIVAQTVYQVPRPSNFNRISGQEPMSRTRLIDNSGVIWEAIVSQSRASAWKLGDIVLGQGAEINPPDSRRTTDMIGKPSLIIGYF